MAGESGNFEPVRCAPFDPRRELRKSGFVKHGSISGKMLVNAEHRHFSRIPILRGGESELFNTSYPAHELFVLEYQDAWISPRPLGQPRYWTLMADNTYLWNLMSNFAKDELECVDRHQEDDSLTVRRSKPLEFSGTVVWLYCWQNLDHTFREAMPFIQFLRERDDFEALRFLVGPSAGRYVELFEHLGVQKHQLIMQENVWLRVEHLIFPSLHTFGHLHTPSRVLDMFRREALDALGPSEIPPKRLFLSRADTPRRCIINEQEVFEKLKPYGFELVTPGDYTILEQIRLQQNAEWIVGSHGMGFATSLFSERPRGIVEAFSPNHLRNNYWRTAQVNGAGYGGLIGVPVSEKQDAPFKIKADEFLQLVQDVAIQAGADL